MPGEQFLRNIGSGKPLFPAEVIRSYVEEDRDLMHRIQPDLVVGDMRPSLPISARLESVRFAVLFNAYWSPYARRRSVVPSIPITRLLPARRFAPLYNLTEPLVYRVHTREANKVRREHDIPALPPDIRVMYTEGDYTLYPDIPEFVPTANRPTSHRYVGICDWSPPAALPDWWDRMLSDSRPKVFVSLGSSGPLQVLPDLLRALSRLAVAVVLSTSGRPMPPLPENVYSAALLPFKETAMASRLVVSHGGSGGLYPAIAAGTPVLGIPSNADQHLSTAVLEENGAGLGIRVEEATEKCLLDSLQKLLSGDRYLLRARQWAEIFAHYPTSELFPAFLRETLGGEGPPNSKA